MSARGAIGARGPDSPASEGEYVPDPRNDADWWTVRRFLEERRPRLRDDGSGGSRMLWAICNTCSAERTVDATRLRSMMDVRIGALNLKCKCGGQGRAVLRWLNPPRPQSEAELATGKWRVHKPRPGWFDFTTGEKRGGWD